MSDRRSIASTCITSSDLVNMQITSVKLNGHNYSLWARAVKAALEARKKLKFVLSDPPLYGSREFREWQSDDCLVMLWLWNSMEPTIASKVTFLTTAKEVWGAVQEMYSVEDNVHAMVLQASSEFSSMSISRGEDNSVLASSSVQNDFRGRHAGNRGGFGVNCGRGRRVDGGRECGRSGRGRGRSGRGRGREGKQKCEHCGGTNHAVDTCFDLHGRPAALQKWKEIQNFLKKRLVKEDDFSWKLPVSRSTSIVEEENEKQVFLKYVGGVDVSFLKEDPSIACGSLVVLDFDTLEVVYEDFSQVSVHVPYIAGFLAFREAPVLLQLLEKMKNSNNPFYPQVLMVDGNGLLHPRGFGWACHLGVLANLPTIGIGKNLHFVDGLTDDKVRRLLQAKENMPKGFVTLSGRSGRIWGKAMRSSEGSLNPIYISIGHRISLDTATKIVQLTCKYRVPEPIRQADMRSREYLRKH